MGFIGVRRATGLEASAPMAKKRESNAAQCSQTGLHVTNATETTHSCGNRASRTASKISAILRPD